MKTTRLMSPRTKTKMIERIKTFLTDAWQKTKYYLAVALVSVGLMTAAPVQALVAWTWSHPTLNEDGSPLALADIRETRRYCGVDPGSFVPQAGAVDGSHVPTEVWQAPANTGNAELPYGRNECFATTVAAYTVDGIITLMESQPSNIVVKIVTPPRPQPPNVQN